MSDPATDPATMASPPECSGRRSGRVESPDHEPTEFPAPTAVSAPESLTRDRVRRSANGDPERQAVRPTPRLTDFQLRRLEHSLSERDEAIISSLQQYRFLQTSHLERLHFADHASPVASSRVCRRVLKRLASLQVIEHLDRRIGGVRAGSASYIWRLGLLGDRLQRGDPDQPRARRKEPSLRNLEHWLAIAETALALTELARASSLELVTVDTEPVSWRSYLGLSGDRQTLKPDLYAVTAAGEFEDHWFCEIDRGTESIPTVLRKCVQYETYRRTGQEQHQHGVYPLVVWITHTDRHARRIHDAIATSRALDPDHFRVCTLNDFTTVIEGGAL